MAKSKDSSDQNLFNFGVPSSKPASPRAGQNAAPDKPAPAEPKPEKQKIYSVTQLNALIKGVLDSNLPSRITVIGELSDFRCHASGHCYFVIKEDGSQLACVMWASSFKKVKFKPENGMSVILNGHIEVYVPGGKYQFYPESMEPEGKGALQLAFEQMVRRLETEGLFKPEHKKPLPPFPIRIGVITSESGAALHDIVVSIRHRWPPAQLLLYSVPVQGSGAAKAIASAITDINRRNRQLKLELLIVGRGGGSLEDLWAFNEEPVARAIFASKIPVISAVGHEVDTTIADLVADARAATPTKAAVLAVPDIREVTARIDAIEERLYSQARNRINFCTQNLETVLASALFRNPLGPVLNAVQKLDELTSRLDSAMKNRVVTARGQVQTSYEKIVQIEPHRLMGRYSVELGSLQNRMQASFSARISQAKFGIEQNHSRLTHGITAAVSRANIQLTAAENRLGALDPRSVLNRGYSITRSKKTGTVVTDPAQIETGEMITTEFAGENFVESSVVSKHNMHP